MVQESTYRQTLINRYRQIDSDGDKEGLGFGWTKPEPPSHQGTHDQRS